MAANPNVQTATPPAQEEAGRKPIPKACSFCANCGIAVDDGVVFCEPFCEHEWKRFHW